MSSAFIKMRLDELEKSLAIGRAYVTKGWVYAYHWYGESVAKRLYEIEPYDPFILLSKAEGDKLLMGDRETYENLPKIPTAEWERRLRKVEKCRH